MITPFFTIKQDNKFLYILIKAPCAKLKSTVVEIGGLMGNESELYFSSHPYFLKLYLPGRIAENGQEEVKWNVEDGSFEIKAPKLNEGEHFDGLDMITKLLTNPKKSTNKINVGGIEVLNETVGETNNPIEDEEFDWSIEQNVVTEEDEASLLQGEKYGFGCKYTGILSRLQDIFVDVIEVNDPDHTPVKRRRAQRLQKEQSDFSDDHYLADLYEEDHVIANLITIPMPWEQVNSDLNFTEDEIFRLKNLPRRNYLLDLETRTSVLLGLADILYAYAYDARTTEGEHNSESGWTIAKLSATLSWFDVFNSTSDLVFSNIRRSLCYPLYRNWNLSQKVVRDVICILRRGSKCVIRCLLQVHALLNKESRYILNDLYVSDYCVWVQSIKNTTFSRLAQALEGVQIEKPSVFLDLPILEQAAKLALDEESSEKSVNNLIRSLSNVGLSSSAEGGIDSDDCLSSSEEEAVSKKVQET